jgi:hypothetical protein
MHAVICIPINHSITIMSVQLHSCLKHHACNEAVGYDIMINASELACALLMIKTDSSLHLI